jgi:hypothetical protein
MKNILHPPELRESMARVVEKQQAKSIKIQGGRSHIFNGLRIIGCGEGRAVI